MKYCKQVENSAHAFVSGTVARYGAASALARARRITHEYPKNHQPQWLTRSIEILEVYNEISEINGREVSSGK